MLNVLLILVAMSIAVPYAIFRISGQKNGKQCLMMNIIGFFSIIGVAFVGLMGVLP